jgi:hypothetical protein
MKNIITIFLLMSLCQEAFCQYKNYSKYDRKYSYVSEVEDMSSYEIQMYNLWKSRGESDTICLEYLNAARAQDNLIAAPAAIISYTPFIQEDSLSEDFGLNQIFVEMINTTPKAIAEITLIFTFTGDYGQELYDIRTGDKYCTMSFKDLAGRTSSNKYRDIFHTVLQTYHILDYRKAEYFVPFYNKKTNIAHLEDVIILYKDGSTTNNIAVWDDMYQDIRLYEEGPLEPIVKQLEAEEGK